VLRKKELFIVFSFFPLPFFEFPLMLSMSQRVTDDSKTIDGAAERGE
jgi:uncharacterized membrane protein YgcG